MRNDGLFRWDRKSTKNKDTVKRNLKKCLGDRKKFTFTGMGVFEAV